MPQVLRRKRWHLACCSGIPRHAAPAPDKSYREQLSRICVVCAQSYIGRQDSNIQTAYRVRLSRQPKSCLLFLFGCVSVSAQAQHSVLQFRGTNVGTQWATVAYHMALASCSNGVLRSVCATLSSLRIGAKSKTDLWTICLLTGAKNR